MIAPKEASSMDNAYALEYRNLYQRHWWWRAREAAILKELKRTSIPRGGQILDIGCGDGLFFDSLARFGQVEGVEVDRSIVSDDGPHRDRIHVGPFDESFAPGKKYSLIVMLDVLEHLPDPAGALDHALSLLDDGGVMAITVPAFNELWTAHDDMNRHYIRYTKPTFGSLARQVGLKIDRWRYLFQWTCPVKLAIRLKEKLRPAVDSLPRVPAAPINAALYALSRFEQAILWRTPAPFGSSLLAVGRHSGSGFPRVSGANGSAASPTRKTAHIVTPA
jgi:SAM-dependent methyltransferase